MLPHFGNWVEPLAGMLSPDRPAWHRKTACCVFDDLLEHAAEHAPAYDSLFLAPFLQCVVDLDAQVRQAAAYGVGLMARLGKAHYGGVVRQAVGSLAQAAQMGSRRKFYQGHAIDNCVSAVGKVIQYAPELIDNYAAAVHGWLRMLPLTHDVMEGKANYELLCELLETRADSHQFLFRPELLSQIVGVFVVAAAENADLRARIRSRMCELQTNLAPDVQAQAWALLDSVRVMTQSNKRVIAGRARCRRRWRSSQQKNRSGIVLWCNAGRRGKV